MPRFDQSHPDNLPGAWFVDTRCIRCDAARHWAPDLIGMDASGRSIIARQPNGPKEEADLWRAAAACPTRSIGNLKKPVQPPGIFPYPLTEDVFALGNNSRASFGAHSYLATRPEGNLMIDSPRFSRPLAVSVDDLGGIAHVLLSHRDDVADYDLWADRYGARVWIGEADADAAPHATDLIGEEGVALISPGVLAIPAPGHTLGHVVYHIDDGLLFTGDTLHWNHRRGELDVFPNQTFHSWEILADTLERLSVFGVEWVFPGHGMWHHIGIEEWSRQLVAMGPAMRTIGQRTWAQRPHATYNWYRS